MAEATTTFLFPSRTAARPTSSNFAQYVQPVPYRGVSIGTPKAASATIASSPLPHSILRSVDRNSSASLQRPVLEKKSSERSLWTAGTGATAGTPPKQPSSSNIARGGSDRNMATSTHMIDMEMLEESFERMSSSSSQSCSTPTTAMGNRESSSSIDRRQCTNPMSVTLWQCDNFPVSPNMSSPVPLPPTPLASSNLPYNAALLPPSNDGAGTNFVRPTATRMPVGTAAAWQGGSAYH